MPFPGSWPGCLLQWSFSSSYRRQGAPMPTSSTVAVLLEDDTLVRCTSGLAAPWRPAPVWVQDCAIKGSEQRLEARDAPWRARGTSKSSDSVRDCRIFLGLWPLASPRLSGSCEGPLSNRLGSEARGHRRGIEAKRRQRKWPFRMGGSCCLALRPLAVPTPKCAKTMCFFSKICLQGPKNASEMLGF